MADFKYHEVWTSSGKSTMRIRKGRTGSPQFWSRVEDAEAEGLRYCGHCHLALDAGDMFAKFQCRACYEARMVRFTNYRPPRERQCMDSIRGSERGGGHGVPTAVDHRAYWGQYVAEDAARAAERDEAREALRLLAEFEAELGTVGTTNSPETVTTPVEVEPDYSLYDGETATRLAALRQQLREGIE